MKNASKKYSNATSYSVSAKGDLDRDTRVFTTKSLPKGGRMKVLSRKVFEGAVKAAMRVKQPS